MPGHLTTHREGAHVDFLVALLLSVFWRWREAVHLVLDLHERAQVLEHAGHLQAGRRSAERHMCRAPDGHVGRCRGLTPGKEHHFIWVVDAGAAPSWRKQD